MEGGPDAVTADELRKGEETEWAEALSSAHVGWAYFAWKAKDLHENG